MNQESMRQRVRSSAVDDALLAANGAGSKSASTGKPSATSASVPRASAAASGTHRSKTRTVLPAPEDFFGFNSFWTLIAVFCALGVITGNVDRVVSSVDPPFVITVLLGLYHFTLHVLITFRDWSELRKIWGYAAVLGLLMTWTQRMQTTFDKPFFVPPAIARNDLLTENILFGLIPVRLALWNVIPPFAAIYIGFLSHKRLHSPFAGYVGAALTTGFLYLAAYDLSAVFFKGALGEFKGIRYIPLPEPEFLKELAPSLFNVFPRPPYFNFVPLYMAFPSFAYGAVVFEGYKFVKAMGRGAGGGLAVAVGVAMAYMGMVVTSYSAVESS